MADKKISQLTAATTPLAGTEVLPIVQSGSTVKVSAADVTAGRAVSALSMTLTGSPLAATSGGTGQSSAFTANGVPYASSTSALATGSVLSFDGSLLSVSSAGAKAQVVSGSLNNTGTALLVQNDNKTTGKLARFYSNNGSASNSGNLVEIVNDFNSGGTADLLYLQQDDDGDGLQIVMDRGGAGIKVTASTGNCAEFTNGNIAFMTSGKGINDGNNNELVKFTATASAVNELTVANAATGNGPTISATGSDTNISINLTAKGSGNVNVTNTNLNVTNKAIAASFNTTASTLSVDNNTATTLYTMPGAGVYTVHAYLLNTGLPDELTAIAIISCAGTSAFIRSNLSGANMVFSLSGLNVQITQTAGSTQTVYYSVQRIA